MECIEIEFELTGKDFTEATKLHGDHSMVKKALKFTLLFALIVLCLATALLLSRNDGGIPTPQFEWSFHWLLILVGGIAAVLGVIQSRRRFAKLLLGKPFCCKFGDGRMQWSSPDGEGRVKMSVFDRWFESSNLFVLSDGQTMNILPKRAFKGTSGETFREFLIQNVGPVGKLRK